MIHTISAKFEEDDTLVADAEVDVVAGLVGDDRGEALAHDAVPVGAKSIHKY